jgi:hypothetical protein
LERGSLGTFSRLDARLTFLYRLHLLLQSLDQSLQE